MKNSRINDIAKTAGVSVSTVSRVFNNRPYVKEELRKRVLEVAVDMDYTPKSMARRDTISIVISRPDDFVSNNYERSLVNRFFAAASELKLNLEFIPLDHIKRVYQNFSKAVIGMIYSEHAGDILRTVRNIPVLTVNYRTDGCSFVCTDHEAGVYRATSYLLENGHREIAILLAPYKESMSWGECARLDGYRKALEEYGIAFRRELVMYGGSEILNSSMKVLLHRHPTALIACGESLIMPLKYSLDLLNLKVPEDISLITFYSSEVTPFLLPEQTCIRQDFDQLARIAMEKVCALIEEEETDVGILLPNEFIEGNSVRRLN